MQHDGDEDEGLLSELAFILKLASQRIRRPNFRVKHAVGSVVTQLGRKAFLVIVSALSIFALLGQQVARRVRHFHLDPSGAQLPAWFKAAVPDVAAVLENTKTLVHDATSSLKYERIAIKVFDEYCDIDGNGNVDANELYALSLKLYCTTINYLPQVLTPPPLSHIQTLFRTFDVDRSGTLNREEFILLASIWFENCAFRIAAQSTISLLLAPYAAQSVTTFLSEWVVSTHTEAPQAQEAPPWWTLFGLGWARVPEPPATVDVTLGESVARLSGELLPAAAKPFVANRAFVTTTFAAVLVAVCVPATLTLLDEYYSLRAARKTSRALASVRLSAKTD